MHVVLGKDLCVYLLISGGDMERFPCYGKKKQAQCFGLYASAPYRDSFVSIGWGCRRRLNGTIGGVTWFSRNLQHYSERNETVTFPSQIKKWSLGM